MRQGKLRDQRPTGLHDLPGKERISGWVNSIRPAAQHRHRAARTERTAVSRSIHTQGQPTDNHKATGGQIPGKAATVIQPIRRGITRTDHGKARRIERLHTATYRQHPGGSAIRASSDG